MGVAEEILINYGVAGVMLLYFMFDKMSFQKDFKMLIQNNTIALTKVYEELRRR